MNLLSTDKRVQVISAFVEGVGVNAISRMTGVSKCCDPQTTGRYRRSVR